MSPFPGEKVPLVPPGRHVYCPSATVRGGSAPWIPMGFYSVASKAMTGGWWMADLKVPWGESGSSLGMDWWQSVQETIEFNRWFSHEICCLSSIFSWIDISSPAASWWRSLDTLGINGPTTIYNQKKETVLINIWLVVSNMFYFPSYMG